MVVASKYLLRRSVPCQCDELFADEKQLTTSTRYGESRAAYREVQERQQELQKVEATLAELAQLFSEVYNSSFCFTMITDIAIF